MTLQTQRDYINRCGGLIKLAPLRPYALSEPDFYRILGTDVTVAHIKSILTNPEEARHDWVAVYRDAEENLEEIIEALSQQPPDEDEYGPFDINEEIRETVLNYHKKEVSDLPELRSRFQRYKLILENCYNKIQVTEQEETDKKDFIKMLNFFLRLEQNHQSQLQYLNSLDDE